MAPIPPEPSWPIPQFNLRIEDLAHPGVPIFLEAVGGNPVAALRNAVLSSFQWLYTPQTMPRNVKTIDLFLRSMDGVAYAHGDAEHKHIHFSLDYIVKSVHRAREEVLGVLTHEVVHCYQYDAQGTCPSGLIEGMAGTSFLPTIFRRALKIPSMVDYVRLRAELAPPHWRKSGGDDWDAGYDRTAYFLAWLEDRYGDGTVQELNARMLGVEYDERIFKRTTGRPVRKLWRIYCQHLEDKKIGE